MTTNIVIELPDDPEAAVLRLRHELRAARRRRALARQTAGFATIRLLGGTEARSTTAHALPGAWTGAPR